MENELLAIYCDLTDSPRPRYSYGGLAAVLVRHPGTGEVRKTAYATERSPEALDAHVVSAEGCQDASPGNGASYCCGMATDNRIQDRTVLLLLKSKDVTPGSE